MPIYTHEQSDERDELSMLSYIILEKAFRQLSPLFSLVL